MPQSTSSQTYTKVAIALHWLIAVLLIGQVLGGLYMHELSASTRKFEIYQLHKSFGIVILLLSLARLAWRIGHKTPGLPAGMKPWEIMAARLTHIGFYVLMIGVPLLGWIMVSASPKDLPTVLFKTLPWPHIPAIPQSEALEGFMKDMHKILALGIFGLLALHVGAALKHHFIVRDDILSRMLPFLKTQEKHKG